MMGGLATYYYELAESSPDVKMPEPGKGREWIKFTRPTEENNKKNGKETTADPALKALVIGHIENSEGGLNTISRSR